MTGMQESKFIMELTTREVLGQNVFITGSLPTAFTGLYSSFTANLTLIQGIREQQGIDKSGIAENKDLQRADLVKKSLDGSRKIEAYAKITGNVVLEREIHFSETVLKRATDGSLKDMGQLVFDRGTGNATALASYGITAAWLTALKSSIDTFNGLIPKPRLGIIERKQATEQLASLMAANDDILVKIDALIEVVRVSQPLFYSAYKSARMVLEHGHSLTVKGEVKDMAGAGVSGASVSFVLDGVVSLVKTTAEGGGFSIKSLAEGAYVVTVSKLGYVAYTTPLNVLKGEMATISVSLVKG